MRMIVRRVIITRSMREKKENEKDEFSLLTEQYFTTAACN